jgi:hypothetical protein
MSKDESVPRSYYDNAPRLKLDREQFNLEDPEDRAMWRDLQHPMTVQTIRDLVRKHDADTIVYFFERGGTIPQSAFATRELGAEAHPELRELIEAAPALPFMRLFQTTNDGRHIWRDVSIGMTTDEAKRHD